SSRVEGSHSSSRSDGKTGSSFAHSNTGNTPLVKSTSISSYHGSSVDAWHFRGDGDSGKKSTELPIKINSSHIYNSIITKDSFSSTFKSFTGTEPEFEPQINSLNFSSSSTDSIKIPLKILDTARPVAIGNAPQYFFWGNNSLPSKTMEGCFNFTTSNSNEEVSLCDVKEMDRCTASISELPHFTPFKFLAVDGQRITQFAWLCPKGQICCGWECCDTVTWTKRIIIVLSIIAILILLGVIGFGVLYWPCYCEDQKMQREVMENIKKTDPMNRCNNVKITSPPVYEKLLRSPRKYNSKNSS
ncbi:hypothetical protein PFISCL1PPCAC_2482, partial [Pristionchus fissidentatus]